jgi:hypothetical protein
MTDKTYKPFEGEETEVALEAPTNARVKELMRLELRLTTAGTQEQREEMAKTLGLDPGRCVPAEDNDVQELSPFAYLPKAAGVVLGIDVGGKSDSLRLDVAQDAIQDFTSGVRLTNGATGT